MTTVTAKTAGVKRVVATMTCTERVITRIHPEEENIV